MKGHQAPGSRCKGYRGAMNAAAEREAREPSGQPGLLSLQGPRREGHLRRQGAEPALAGAQLLRTAARATAGPSSRLLDELLGDIEVVLTGNEKEALILENTLIKKHRPRFNVMLRDDKAFISSQLGHDASPIRGSRSCRRARARATRASLLRPLQLGGLHPRDAADREPPLPAADLLGRASSEPQPAPAWST